MRVLFLVYVGNKMLNLRTNFLQEGNNENLPMELHLEENILDIFYMCDFVGYCHLYWG